MADKTTVGNLALQKLGEDDQLTNVDTDDSHAGRTIRVAFDTVRRATLRRGKFNFSLTRGELAAQNLDSIPAPPSPFPYLSRFPLPTGCLRVVEVRDAAGRMVTDYKVEGGAILADIAGPLFLLYVRDVVETVLWDDMFVEACAARLAFQVCERITGDRGRKSDCWADFRKAIADASGVDAKEDPPTEGEESSWVEARY